MVELKLIRCTLRPWKLGDADSLAANANNNNIRLHVRDAFPYPYTIENAHWWINEGCRAENRYNLAIAVGEKAVGGIGLVFHEDIYRRSAEVGYWLGETYWGRGIVTEAVEALVAFAFRRFDLVRVHAGVFETNAASRRVLEKAGFTYEGRLRKSIVKDGKVLDELLYAKLRDESGVE